MPNYKIVNADQLDADLKAVANSIREKSGQSGNLAFPSGFVSAVNGIETGGGGGGCSTCKVFIYSEASCRVIWSALDENGNPTPNATDFYGGDRYLNAVCGSFIGILDNEFQGFVVQSELQQFSYDYATWFFVPCGMTNARIDIIW